MTDDIKLPPLPRLQVPLIEADVSLLDIKVLARWCERTATDYARAAVLADREGRQQARMKPAMSEMNTNEHVKVLEQMRASGFDFDFGNEQYAALDAAIAALKALDAEPDVDLENSND